LINIKSKSTSSAGDEYYNDKDSSDSLGHVPMMILAALNTAVVVAATTIIVIMIILVPESGLDST